LLSNRENLRLDGRRSLKKLLEFNTRLNTAYLLKESFGQLWSYEKEGWARRFVESWDGISAYYQPENKVSLGFVEGLNNKIRVLQRRAYGLRDEAYSRLKLLTCMLLQI